MRLKDIANELGVSISTISRALNHPELNAAGPELTQRILAVAEREGYSPDPIARRLRQPLVDSSADNLYVLIARPQAEVKDDPFYNTISTSISREASACRRVIRCTYSVPDSGLEGLLTNFMPEIPGDVIIIGRFSPALMPALRSVFRHIVYVGINRLDVDCDQVLCDGYEAAQAALSHLYGLGHRCFGFIGAEPEERSRGFLRGAERLALPEDSFFTEQTDMLSLDGGYRGMCSLLRRAPQVTGVICANDMVAIGALQACKDQGLRVPEDLSLIGIDDVPSIRFVEPKLTTIHVPMEEMGRLAVRALQDRVYGVRTLPVRFMTPYTLIERDSCRARS